MDRLVYWIWLSLACSVGGNTFTRLLEKYSDAKDIFEADNEDINRIIGYRNSDRNKLNDKNLDRAIEIYDFCRKHNVGIVAYCDDSYPKKLKEISSPPVLLYYRGTWQDFDRCFAVSVVGTRALSDYGRRYAFNISYDLALSGAVIISGMACGIDGVAHCGALKGDGTTVAVLGSGIDVCYPPQHQKLAKEIVKHGCVITEYAPGTPPSRYNFPKRNRLICGLSATTLVIEGKEKSGAYITASYAKDQGKRVYALPGNIGSSTSQLTNLLIKNGAYLCTSADDIVHDFIDEYHGLINPFKLTTGNKIDYMSALSELSVVALCPDDNVFYHSFNKPLKVAAEAPKSLKRDEENHIEEVAIKTTSEPPSGFDRKALSVYKNIPTEGDVGVEDLVRDGLNLREVMSALLKLEMGGFVKMLPSDRVMRK